MASLLRAYQLGPGSYYLIETAMPADILLATAQIPDTRKELRLYQQTDGMYSIKMPGRGELMNTRAHGSERALAELACERITAHGHPRSGRGHPRLLVGGLGMGFTLAAALDALGPQAQVVVAELVPEVVDWNREITGEAAGHPLADPRTTVYIGDVAALLRAEPAGFDAILMDVDNGPEALARRENDWLYTVAGLEVTRRALRPRGILTVWSAAPDRLFTARLSNSGFQVEEVPVRTHRRKGSRHHIWVCSPKG